MLAVIIMGAALAVIGGLYWSYRKSVAQNRLLAEN